MKWKRVSAEFLPEKTFLIIKDDLQALQAKENLVRRGKPKSAVDTGTWPPKLKNNRSHQPYPNAERPKTANLERPSVLDPRLLKKLDMSLVCKEVLCDSMTRIQLGVKSRHGGGILGSTTCGTGVSRRRQSVPVPEKSCSLSSSLSRKQREGPFYEEDTEQSTTSLPIAMNDNTMKRRGFEHRTNSEIVEASAEPSSTKKQPGSRHTSIRNAESHETFVKRRSSDSRRLDDNNNRNNGNATSGKISLLSTVRKNKPSKSSVTSEIEVFTGISTKFAPEPCKTCGRPDQPERFHSHPKGSSIVAKKEPAKDDQTGGKTKIAVPKTIQKPVALNFRSEKSKIKSKALEDAATGNMNGTKSRTPSPRDSREGKNSKTPPGVGSASRKGPRTVTCYICAREFGTASFPIHEPKCKQKWERENNALPASQRRPIPQRPIVPVDHYDWNTAAWEQSQAQLIPCWKCGRTFHPDRLEVHQRSCKATPKVSALNSSSGERLEKLELLRTVTAPTTVLCQICGRNFGSRSIKIHEPQCMKKWRAANEALPPSQRKKSPPIQENSPDFSSYPSPASPTRQSTPRKPTTTCYICGRDFGSASFDIHEPQCLRKWQNENSKLPAHQQRDEPQKPEIVYKSESSTGDSVIDWAATTEARWQSHLELLVPCKNCKRTFNPERVAVHERSCKGNR